MKEIFQTSLRGNGLKEICRELNERGITNRGKRWYKGGLHYLLTNEAYTGTLVWGKASKGEQAPEPVRVKKAWKPLVSRRLFENVQQALHERAPVTQRPARVGSKFLLSGLLQCGVCGRPYIGHGAKSGQYGYYICGTLQREGAGTCRARRAGDAGRRGDRRHGRGDEREAESCLLSLLQILPTVGRQPCTYRKFTSGTWDEIIWSDICALLRDDAWIRKELSSQRS